MLTTHLFVELDTKAASGLYKYLHGRGLFQFWKWIIDDQQNTAFGRPSANL